MRRFALVAATIVSLVTMPRDGWAQRPPPSEARQACVASSERAQHFRLDGKLYEAQQELITCSREDCPAMIRNDCTTWLTEVTSLMPSVVIAARDPFGADIIEVRVFIDGQLFASRLDGKSVTLSTGEHLIRLERDGAPALEQRVLVREGEKARPITFEWRDAVPPPANPSSKPGQPASHDRARPHTIPPWIAVGVGGAAAVSGAILYVVERGAVPSQCNFDSRVCVAGSSQQVKNDAGSATQVADIGLVVGVVGLGVLAGGLVWHFLEPTGAASSASVTSLPGMLASRPLARAIFMSVTPLVDMRRAGVNGASFSASF